MMTNSREVKCQGLIAITWMDTIMQKGELTLQSLLGSPCYTMCSGPDLSDSTQTFVTYRLYGHSFCAVSSSGDFHMTVFKCSRLRVVCRLQLCTARVCSDPDQLRPIPGHVWGARCARPAGLFPSCWLAPRRDSVRSHTWAVPGGAACRAARAVHPEVSAPTALRGPRRRQRRSRRGRRPGDAGNVSRTATDTAL